MRNDAHIVESNYIAEFSVYTLENCAKEFFPAERMASRQTVVRLPGSLFDLLQYMDRVHLRK